MSNVWVIKAGENGEDQGFALDNRCAVIGWGELGDLTGRDKDSIKGDLIKEFGYSAQSAGQKFRSIGHFFNDVEKGDWVVLPLRDKRGNRSGYSAVGKVQEGGYRFVPDASSDGRKHQIPVDWEYPEFPNGDIPRKMLMHYVRRTVNLVKNDDLRRQFIRAVDGKGDVASISGGARDVQQFIKDNFEAKDRGDPMERLVAEILDAMGYDCERSERSTTPDGGVDIFASHRELVDFVCVEVKSGSKQQGSDTIGKLAGAMHRLQVTKGLFVSWGGFGLAREAELKKEYPFIRLWNAEDVVRLVDKYYDKFGWKFLKKKDLPLKRELFEDLELEQNDGEE